MACGCTGGPCPSDTQTLSFDITPDELQDATADSAGSCEARCHALLEASGWLDDTGAWVQGFESCTLTVADGQDSDVGATVACTVDVGGKCE